MCMSDYGFSIVDISIKTKPIIYKTKQMLMGGDTDDAFCINEKKLVFVASLGFFVKFYLLNNSKNNC